MVQGGEAVVVSMVEVDSEINQIANTRFLALSGSPQESLVSSIFSESLVRAALAKRIVICIVWAY